LPICDAGPRSLAPAADSDDADPAARRTPPGSCRDGHRPRHRPGASSSSGRTPRYRSPSRSGRASGQVHGSSRHGRRRHGTPGGMERAWCTSFPATLLSATDHVTPTRASVPFEHEFAAESLIGAKAVIGDENAVGAYYTNIKRFKSAVSKEMISINRKYQKEIGYRFSGMIFEPLNEMPKFKDTTLSSWRRWLILPMLNKFATSGGKRPEFKSDFIKRKEVLEYFAWRALSMDFDWVRDTARSREMVGQAQLENDTVLEFWEEFEDQFVWDLLPASFLHALYVAWLRRDNPSGKPVSQRVLSSRLKEHLEASDSWEFMENAVRTGNKMSQAETLISEYDLKDWFNPGYTGPDSLRKCLPALKDKYRGLQRIGTNPAATAQAQAAANSAPTG